MPLYEYVCVSCNRTFEAYKRVSEEKGEDTCPSCGGRATKQGISRVSAKTAGGPGKGPGSSCGGVSHRSPFS